MTAEPIAGWERTSGEQAHWLDVDGSRACDPSGERRPVDDVSPWRASGAQCRECAQVIAAFRALADHRGFELSPRFRYPASS